MTDNTSTIDPFDMPSGAIPEPAFPILKEGIKTLIIRDCELKTSEPKEGKQPFTFFQLKLATTELDQSTENKPLHPGFVFIDMLGLTPNEQNTVADIAARIGMFLKSALGKENTITINQFKQDPSIVKDKIVKAKVVVKKSKDPQYDDKNVVKNWIVA